MTDRPSSIAYAYVCRHFQIPSLTDASTEEVAEIKKILSTVIHFIGDRKSTVLHASLSAAVTDVWSRLGEVSELTASPTPSIESFAEPGVFGCIFAHTPRR